MPLLVLCPRCRTYDLRNGGVTQGGDTIARCGGACGFHGIVDFRRVDNFAG